MPYSNYLFLHLVSLSVFLISLTSILILEKKSKIANISFGASSLFVLIAGFGLLAKTGYSTTSFWVLVKLAIWLLLSILTPVINKRLPEKKPLFLKISIALIIIAIYFVVFKV